MLQKTYSIYSEELSNQQLFIEAGKNHLACWCKKAGDKKLNAFELFQCDAYTGASFENMLSAARLHSRLLTMKVAETKFILNTDETICIPFNSDHNGNDFLKQNFELLFGASADASIFSEEYNGYLIAARIEKGLQDSLRSSFPGAKFHLQYNCLLPALNANGNGNTEIVYLFFYPYYFSLIVFKQGKLQLLQTRTYNNAEDVLYFVLNIFKQYNIDNKTEIVTGGFINEESKLYQTLYQYAEGLKLAQVDEELFATGGFKDYSSHYFLPYANYVL
jgi:hypothetical protein